MVNAFIVSLSTFSSYSFGFFFFTINGLYGCFPFFAFVGVVSFFDDDCSLLGVSLSVVFFFFACKGVLDVDDLFLRCLEINDASHRRS